MIFKEIEYKDSSSKFDWEEIPQEEIWEDGERNAKQVEQKVIDNVMHIGNWVLIRRVENE